MNKTLLVIRILFIAQGVDEVIDDEFVMTPRGLVRVQLDFPGDDPGADPNERTDPALAKRRFLERCERVLKGRVDFFFIAGLPNHMVSGLQDEP